MKTIKTVAVHTVLSGLVLIWTSLQAADAPPVANAGVSRVYDPGIAAIALDGSLSADPEGMPLSYRWTQVSGWDVQLSDPQAVNPAFALPWPGTYVFQLVVNDGMQDSLPALVRITVGDNHAPVANAGPSLYVLTNSVTLDGAGSYDPDGDGSLAYEWKQISGPTVTMTGTNSARPVIGGFRPTAVIQNCVFQLRVSDGNLTSAPSLVTITIVPNYGTNALYLENPPFDPTRPTIVAFGGGDCRTGSGSGLSSGGLWESQRNWITMQTFGTAYDTYVLARDAWGKGFATEALSAIVDAAARIGVTRLFAACHPEHRPSQRVLEKCRFVRDDVSKPMVEFPNLSPGVRREALNYAIALTTHLASLRPRARRISLIALAMILAATVFAQFGKLGATGDRLTDEYFEGQAGYAKNWPQLLVDYRGVDMGLTAAQAGGGTWGESRRRVVVRAVSGLAELCG